MTRKIKKKTLSIFFSSPPSSLADVVEAMAVDGGGESVSAPKSDEKRPRLVLLAELVGHDGRVWGLDWSPEGSNRSGKERER